MEPTAGFEPAMPFGPLYKSGAFNRSATSALAASPSTAARGVLEDLEEGNSMDAEISRATGADLGELLALVAAYRAFYEREPEPEHERDFMARNLAEKRSVVFIARRGRNAVGFAQLFQTYSTVWLGPSLILEDLYVAPEGRRGGVASALLARAEHYAREIGAVGMFLETAMDNAVAQSVYERAGWTREARFFKYNAPP